EHQQFVDAQLARVKALSAPWPQDCDLEQNLEEPAVEHEAPGCVLRSPLRERGARAILEQERVEALDNVLAVEATAERDDHLDVGAEFREAHLGDRLQLGIERGVLRTRGLLDKA